MEDILVLAAAVGLFVKLAVDLVKQTGLVPSRYLPVVACVFGIVLTYIFKINEGSDPLALVTFTQSILSGLASGGGAVGVTILHNEVRS